MQTYHAPRNRKFFNKEIWKILGTFTKSLASHAKICERQNLINIGLLSVGPSVFLSHALFQETVTTIDTTLGGEVGKLGNVNPHACSK